MLPSTAMYSGSRSCETLAPGPKMRTPSSLELRSPGWVVEALEADVPHGARPPRPPRSMIDTDPGGSIV